MPFSIRPFHRFPVQCSVTYNAGPFQDKARSRISPMPAGDYPVICPYDQGKYYHSWLRFPTRSVKRLSEGPEVRNLL